MLVKVMLRRPPATGKRGTVCCHAARAPTSATRSTRRSTAWPWNSTSNTRCCGAVKKFSACRGAPRSVREGQAGAQPAQLLSLWPLNPPWYWQKKIKYVARMRRRRDRL